MAANLDGVREKLRRADYHLTQLKESVNEWGTSENKTDPFVVKDDKKHKILIISHGEVRPNNPTWPLLVGDIVHNLRSALDHLVCQLAVLNGNSVSCCDKTYFPICICKSDLDKAERCSRLLHQDAFTEIKNLQPYKTAALSGLDPELDILWIIHKLDIIDKHRLLVVVGKYFRAVDMSYAFNDAYPTEVPVNSDWKPLEAGAEVGRIDYSYHPHGPED
jgi:hypothetical protein